MATYVATVDDLKTAFFETIHQELQKRFGLVERWLLPRIEFRFQSDLDLRAVQNIVSEAANPAVMTVRQIFRYQAAIQNLSLNATLVRGALGGFGRVEQVDDPEDRRLLFNLDSDLALAEVQRLASAAWPSDAVVVSLLDP